MTGDDNLDESDPNQFDPHLILATLEARQVHHVLVGGVAARAHGAARRTADLDCVPDTTAENYERLAGALRGALHASWPLP